MNTNTRSSSQSEILGRKGVLSNFSKFPTFREATTGGAL